MSFSSVMVVIRRNSILLEVGIAWLFFDKCEDRIMATKHSRASLFAGKKIKKWSVFYGCFFSRANEKVVDEFSNLFSCLSLGPIYYIYIYKVDLKRV